MDIEKTGVYINKIRKKGKGLKRPLFTVEGGEECMAFLILGTEIIKKMEDTESKQYRIKQRHCIYGDGSKANG